MGWARLLFNRLVQQAWRKKGADAETASSARGGISERYRLQRDPVWNNQHRTFKSNQIFPFHIA